VITSTSFSQSDKQQLHTAPDGSSRYPGEQLLSFGPLNAFTMEQDNAVKVHIIGTNIIAALTGWIGLSQRCVTKLRALNNTDKLKKSDPIAQATEIAQE
jgi:hypothetical protein